MTIGVLKKGDRVINVTSDFIAVERKSGEVDIIPLIHNGEMIRIDTENIVTIGFGDNIVESKIGNVKVTNF